MSLTEKQMMAIQMLAEGKSASEVAEKIDISAVSVRNWIREDDEFIDALETAKKDPLLNFDREIGKRLSKILTVIDSLLESPDENKKLKACELLLKYASRGFRKEAEREDDDEDFEIDPDSHAGRFLKELEKDEQ